MECPKTHSLLIHGTIVLQPQYRGILGDHHMRLQQIVGGFTLCWKELEHFKVEEQKTRGANVSTCQLATGTG